MVPSKEQVTTPGLLSQCTQIASDMEPKFQSQPSYKEHPCWRMEPGKNS